MPEDERRANLWGQDRAPLLAHLREALVGKPKNVRGDHADPCTGDCVEVHLLDVGGPRTFSDDEPIDGARYSLFADYDLHAHRYTRAWAYYPGILARGAVVDLSAALA